MANGDLDRTQPEFSLGERLARIEAAHGELDRRFDNTESLFDEKLSGLRKELSAVNSAQKEAVNKTETAVNRQFELITEQGDRRSEVTNSRLQALERGESVGQGAHVAAGEYKASTLAWATIGATLLGGGLIALIIKAVGG